MYGAKAKGSIVKNLSKSLWHRFSKFELYLIKSMKNESQMKSFQSKCKQIGEGSYIFILQVR